MYAIQPIIETEDIQMLTDSEVESNFSHHNLIWLDEYDKDEEHYCFNFALNNTLRNCQEAFEWLEDFYKQIPISQAKKGDIISYHEINNYDSKYEKPCCGNVTHFAKIHKTNGTVKNTIIRSKWGNMGVFETSLEAVPDAYGTAIIIWRKIRKEKSYYLI